MSKKFTIQTPNPSFTGYRDGILFGNGKAVVEDETVARNFVNVRGYRCPQVENQDKEEQAPKVVSDLPADFPFREQLAQNGFTDFVAITGASDSELTAIKGLGPAAVKEIRDELENYQ